MKKSMFSNAKLQKQLKKFEKAMDSKPFTEKELSAILTAHENGLLVKGGEPWDPNKRKGLGKTCKGCVNQFAYNEDSTFSAYLLNCKAAAWFDDNYKPSWSTQKFLNKLTEQGLVE